MEGKRHGMEWHGMEEEMIMETESMESSLERERDGESLGRMSSLASYLVA